VRMPSMMARLLLVVLSLIAAASAAKPVCPMPSGCCCCTGKCLYDGCAPCPCPAPRPGHTPPACSLQSMLDKFEGGYKKVLTSFGATKYSSYPSSTCSPTFDWGFSSGWTSGFFPGLLWQLANNTKDAAFTAAAKKWTAGREVEKTETSGHDIGFMIFGS